MTLPEAVRKIRKRRGMNTSDFAAELGVAQSMISRYERGQRSPRWRFLVKLFMFAEGDEKPPILEALSVAQGRPVVESDAIQDAKRLAREDDIFRRTVDYVNLPEAGRFIWLTSEIHRVAKEQGVEVDESVNRILSVWLHGEGSADAVKYFQDAARFLEIALLPGAGDTTELLREALKKIG